MEKHRPQAMNRSDFNKIVIEEKQVCLVCFMATWSKPSREMEDPVAEVTDRWYSIVPVYTVDPDEEPFIMAEYSVNAVPTFILFKDGQAKEKVVGIRTADEINQYVADNI